MSGGPHLSVAPTGVRVLGVDACRSGWVGIAWGGGEQLWPYLADTVAELVAACADDGPVAVVGVDVPIGLCDEGPRAADALAADRLGARRRSSVFPTPVRAALLAPDHAAASDANRQANGGQGVSQQSYGLRHRILEVDGWLGGPGSGRPPVYEVHPEVTFAEMAGAPLAASKKTWSGAEQRRMLLAREGLFVAGTLGAAGAAAVDDVLDAAAVAWTAARIATGDAVSLPDPPQLVGGGRIAAIWV